MPQIRGPIRARDLRVNIKSMGFEQGIVHSLELLLEEHSENKQHLRSITELLGQCIQQVDRMVAFGDAAKQSIDELRRIVGSQNADDAGKE